ncbi:MAG: hypothetical protein ACREP9_05660, partial [Candidatus Dormibacteraceae bacterium]
MTVTWVAAAGRTAAPTPLEKEAHSLPLHHPAKAIVFQLFRRIIGFRVSARPVRLWDVPVRN